MPPSDTASGDRPRQAGAKTARFALSGPMLDWALLGLLVILWGSAFAGLKIAAETIDPYWMTAVRVCVAAGVLALVVAIRREPVPRLFPRPHPLYAFAFIIGVPGMAVPFLGFSWAAQHVDSAVLAILNGAAPLYTGFLAHYFIPGERMTLARGVGLALGFAGLAVLITPTIDPEASAPLMACLAAAAATFGYAVGNVTAKRAPPVSPLTLAFLFNIWAAIIALVAAFLLEPFPVNAAPEGWVSVALLGAGPTALATVAFVWLIQRRGPVFAATVTYLTPLWAALIGIVFLAERPGVEVWIALALILLGVWAANRERTADQAGDPAKDRG